MPTVVPARVVLFSGDPERYDVRMALSDAGHEFAARAIDDAEPRPDRSVGVFVIDAVRQADQALRLCQRLRSGQQEPYVPILYVAADANARDRVACLESGADVYLDRPFDPSELRAQLQALLRIKERHDQLAAKAAEAGRVSKRLQEVHQQLDLELDLARRIQESFLPQNLPELPRVRFAVQYRPCGHVGGDFYDVFRLDEQHVGFYVADAMGHGVPASLLTIFVKKGVRAKEISGQSYRLVPPEEVLHKLNHDLIEQELADTPFITMAYALFDHTSGTLQFARAGHPHPLHLPADGPPKLLQQPGGLLGVFDTQYTVHTARLGPGDKLLLYTDGIDGAAFAQHPVGLPSLLAAAEHFRAAPVGELVERLAQDLFTQTRQTDDLTMLGVEVVR
jgi:sigma-B regulation protein RsbU (phosphoserine phosphatase)